MENRLNEEEQGMEFIHLHCHTEKSIDDSTLSVAKLCEINKSLGYNAVALTDHGTMMGHDDFMEAAKKVGIKPIYGVEAYYMDPVTGKMDHILLLAKNNEGYRQMRIAFSRAGRASDGRCYLTDDLLKTLAGGNVIVTSACIIGIFGNIILHNHYRQEKIDRLNEEIAAFGQDEDRADEYGRDIEEIDMELVLIGEELKKVKKLSKTSFGQKEKVLATRKKRVSDLENAVEDYMDEETDAKFRNIKKLCGMLEVSPEDPAGAVEQARAEYNTVAAAIEAEKKEAGEAADRVKGLEDEIKDLKETKAGIMAKLDEVQKSLGQVTRKKNKIQSLQEEMLDKGTVADELNKRFAFMKETFGDDFYVEVQNHGIPEEAQVYPYLAKRARKLGIKLVATNDVHTGTASEDDLKARQLRRSCRFKKWEERQVGDDQLYIKTPAEMKEWLSKILPADVVEEAMENSVKIAEMCNAQIVKESHAPKAKDCGDVKAAVVALARKNIQAKYGDEWSQVHEDRFNYEINIIDTMGYMDYFWITCDILWAARNFGALSYSDLDYLKQVTDGQSVIDGMSLEELEEYWKQHADKVHLSTGLGRGSGAGSIVCYLLDITQIDPIKYNLLFERFLNPERISMPDIDSDFRTDIKDVLLVYLKKRYGERAISQILTETYLQGKSALDKASMLLESRDNARYRELKDALKKKEGVDFDNRTLAENRDALMAGVKEGSIEEEIIDSAILLDNNLDHTSLHAAGVIISDNDDLAEYIPVAWDEGSATWKTQCNMVQCEGLHGLLKMDLLLLKTLDIITYTLRLIEKTHPGVEIDIKNLPMEKEIFTEIYGKGDTVAVFQFESGGMVKNLKLLHPECIEDIIAMNAMYRPGPMDEIPNYIAAKNSGNIHYDCPQLEPILKDTYGIIVYQEQCMQIVRDLAGYTLGRSDLVRRAMAKKHLDELKAEKQNFIYGNEAEGIKGCQANGISVEAAETIWGKMEKFASYAFNKAHAAAYSVTSYMTAWLKYYYPAEFLCACMNFAKSLDELPILIHDAEKRGVKVLAPDVNASLSEFSVENGSIRYGLATLRGTKGAADAIVAARGRKFPNFRAFVKAQPGTAIADALIYSGALDTFHPQREAGRNAMHEAFADLSEIYRKGCNAKHEMEAQEENSPKYEAARRKMGEFAAQWKDYKFPEVPEMTFEDRLAQEKAYTSVYFSGNPLDEYEIDENIYVPVAQVIPGYTKVAGNITDQKVVKTKKDGKEMLIGTLADTTGSMDFVIFAKDYARLKGSLKNVMGFSGKVDARKSEGEDGEEERYQLIISGCSILPKRARQAVLWDIPEKLEDLGTGFDIYVIDSETRRAIPQFIRTDEEHLKAAGVRYRIV